MSKVTDPALLAALEGKEPEAPAPSWDEAIARGAAQGVTLRMGDEIGGMARAGLTQPSQPKTTPGPRELATLYPGIPYPEAATIWFSENRPDIQAANSAETARQGQQNNYEVQRDAIRSGNEAARAAHPWLYGGSEVVTGTLPMLAAIPPASGGTLLARIGEGASNAAPSGAALGFGGSEEKTLGGQMLDTFTGAAGAAAAGGAVPVVSTAVRPLASWLSQKLGRGAEAAAVRATNADRTAAERALKGNDSARHEVGRFLLDEDLPLRSPRGTKEGARSIASEAGKEIERISQAADQSGVVADLEAAVNAAKTSRAVSSLAKNTKGRAAFNDIAEMLDDQIAQHGGKVPPSVAHDIRRQLDELADWDATAPKAVKRAWRAARDAVNKELDAAMTSAGVADEWTAANARFSSARKVSNPKTNRGLADVGTARREGNRWGSPSEKAAGVMGAAAATVANPAAALAIPAGTVALNRLGFPAVARTMNAASKALASPPGTGVARGAAPIAAEDFLAWLSQFRPAQVAAAARDEEAP